ncbi:MAG: tRNA (adenosine(37)-N6)-threonylcarbamoyltransferase complex dimerization subunit type 1 TsaB [Oscillospiraceae bacterium]|nr:tRNA (adenosine(37)-N6)-threonylcarbamoyltransferase complex dimerization subunit type 1 TsaB [Oscillospiraceae bacterium]
MLILAFESSAKAASVALLREEELLGEAYQNCGQTHSVTLMKMAEDLMENCNVSREEITAVACAAGPGSFTGVRIGVAAAKGFAWGRQLSCVGVSTLEAMAQQAVMFEGLVCCAMDARRQQVYHALFDCTGGVLTRRYPDCAISLEELAERLKNEEKAKIMVGDGARLCYNTIGKKVAGCILAPEHMMMQRASGVALAARKLLLTGAKFDPAALVPNYLRLSQAERERNERLQKTKEEHNG